MGALGCSLVSLVVNPALNATCFEQWRNYVRSARRQVIPAPPSTYLRRLHVEPSLVKILPYILSIVIGANNSCVVNRQMMAGGGVEIRDCFCPYSSQRSDDKAHEHQPHLVLPRRSAPKSMRLSKLNSRYKSFYTWSRLHTTAIRQG